MCQKNKGVEVDTASDNIHTSSLWSSAITGILNIVVDDHWIVYKYYIKVSNKGSIQKLVCSMGSDLQLNVFYGNKMDCIYVAPF